MGTNALLSAGMDVLIKHLGTVEAERFITLIIREPFDYTEWRKENLFKDMTVEEISKAAMEYSNSIKE
ncbi:MAG: hypothetical protein FWC53_00125 [Firmicutes bacterium]|nr:hypothetical protein [Bacillota bacterium]